MSGSFWEVLGFLGVLFRSLEVLCSIAAFVSVGSKRKQGEWRMRVENGMRLER